MQLSPIEWAKFACDSMMALYAAPELPPAGDGIIIRVFLARDGDVVGGCARGTL